MRSFNQKIPAETPYSILVFLSAFFLFLGQPMVAKIIIPDFGGSASVWNSSMLIGQMMLLAASAYVTKILQHNKKSMLHGIAIATLLPLAFLLPVASFAIVNSGMIPELKVPGIIFANIGVILFFLGMQSPLIQSAYNSDQPQGNPYPLYASSNAGSLIGLLSYPLFIEPFFDIETQMNLWRNAAVAVVVAGTAYTIAKWKSDKNSAAHLNEKIPSKLKAQWLLRAMLAVIIMMTGGQALTSDVMAMPIAWMFPLGAFLIGYMTAFSRTETTSFKKNLKIPQAGIIVLASATSVPTILTIPAVGLISILAIGVVTHGLIRPAYQTRPDAGRLGEFYLMLSIGGAIGGIISAVLAPALLGWRWELVVAIIAAAYMLDPTGRQDTPRNYKTGISIVKLLGIFAVAVSIAFQIMRVMAAGQVTGILLVIIAAAILSTNNKQSFAGWTAILMVGTGIAGEIVRDINNESRRSYYGIITINAEKSRNQEITTLTHGTTIHGIQNRENPESPTMYYTDKSGVGDIMQWAKTERPNAHIAVGGLGAGTIACLAPKQSRMTFYEIDSEIISIATSDFTFIKRCKPDSEITEVDARIGIEKSSGQYDVIILDAFSSDSIPMHLLTSEALNGYKEKLTSGGWILVHTSNRYIDVGSPVATWAKNSGYDARILHNSGVSKNNETDSVWLAIRPDGWENSKEEWKSDKRWIERSSGREWTDQRSSILDVINIW